MNRAIAFTVIVVCSLAAPTIGRAQEQGADEAENPFAQFFDSPAIYEQMAKALTRVMDTYLDFLARPQTTEKLATFQKNYYDALIKKGFSEEQAFQLLRDTGNPLAALSARNSN